ncbi:MAG: ChbG/HpnK family deacetylase [Clostridiales bacterium]|nr:ChbG/HpnK family deacetylase [Clostridiales bacterium]
MDKYLIINADDFGYNEQQTRAIRELYTGGLITSCSLMAVAPCAKKAAEHSARDGFPVGVHLTINSDDDSARWQSISGGSSLSDGKGLYFKQSALAFNAKRRDVRQELEAQYSFISQLGASVDHADNHCATLYGINGRRFFLDAYDFCARHSLPYRFPKCPDFLERQLGRRIPKPLLRAHAAIVNSGLKRGVRLLDDLVSNPQSISQIGSYEDLRDYYINAVRACKPGITEMFLHPAYALDDCISEWTKRVYEFELLKSGDLMCEAEKNGVRLVSWSVFDMITGQ